MTRQEINAGLASILETLAETDSGVAPEGIVCVALMGAGYSFDDFMLLGRLLTTAGLATLEGHELRLTGAGKDMAAKIATFNEETRV